MTKILKGQTLEVHQMFKTIHEYDADGEWISTYGDQTRGCNESWDDYQLRQEPFYTAWEDLREAYALTGATTPDGKLIYSRVAMTLDEKIALAERNLQESINYEREAIKTLDVALDKIDNFNENFANGRLRLEVHMDCYSASLVDLQWRFNTRDLI